MTIFWFLVMLVVIFNDGWIGDFVRSAMIAIGVIMLLALATFCVLWL